MFPTLCASHERSFSAAREFFRRDLRWQVQEAKAQALEAGSYLRGSRCRTWRLSAAMNLKAAPMPSFLWLQDRGAIYKGDCRILQSSSAQAVSRSKGDFVAVEARLLPHVATRRAE